MNHAAFFVGQTDIGFDGFMPDRVSKRGSGYIFAVVN